MIQKEPTYLKPRRWMAKLGSAILVTLIASVLVQGQDVKTNYLPRTDFSKFHIYAWLMNDALPHPNHILDTEIKQAIELQLVAKGFTKVEDGKADLLLDYQVLINQERQWNASGMRSGPFGMGMDTGMGTVTSSTINRGTLLVNMYDPGSKHLVWTGFATKEINLSKTQEKNQKNLEKATRKLLKDFPPQRT